MSGGTDLSASFTIVIPTLQRSALLPELVSRLAGSPQVHEVLVINNASEPWAHPAEKCRVLDMTENIFVNPAWNLGAHEATTGLIGLVNDDVLFDPRILGPIAKRLVRGAGIIGPATACVRGVDAPSARSWHRPLFVPTYERDVAFGTAMFMRRQDYVPIPSDLKVWRGDDYLFRRQVRRNLVMLGIDIRTHMSTTSDDPAFDAVKEADMQAFADLHGVDSYRLRYWKEFRISRAVRSSGRRITQLTNRKKVTHG
ncbi:unannotated protein [freshwater metagenome]|uniref:Unannotated protein n=1 Tax=freshwater metagenome TaxID=449393 RepID=A0A6J7J3H5_9ZZZZ